MKYDYTEKDLLQYPQKYQHSPFEGKLFISEYLKSRKKISEKIKDNINVTSIYDILDLSPISYDEISIKKIDIFVTEVFLIYFLKCTKTKKNEIKIIEKLLKFFEVKKKIYSEYNFKTNTHSEDFTQLRNYILFSLACGKIFKMNKNLKFFNTILKLNDIICSKIDSISDVNDLSLTYNTITFELQQIEKLLKHNLVRL